MKRSVGIRVGLGFLLSAGLGGSIPRSEALEPQLPEGHGRFLVLEACVQCHDLDPIITQRKTPEDWRRSVNEMVWRGAQLMGNEAEVLTNYLAASFGPHGSAPAPSEADLSLPENAGGVEDAVGQYLPPGEGRALLFAACVQCHDLRPILTERRTPEDWRRSIAQMIQLGARLMGDEAEILAHYLSVSFGPDIPVPEALRKSPEGAEAPDKD